MVSALLLVAVIGEVCYILIISLIPLYIRLYHHAQLIVIIINYYSDSTTTSAAAAEEQKEDFLFEECTVQLPYICNSSTTTSTAATTVNDINSNEETHIEGFHWKLASLSKKLVGLTQINTLQTIKITETTINYIQNEIEEICTAIYQLIRLISTAKFLLQDINNSNNSDINSNNIYYDRAFRLQSLRLSFPCNQYTNISNNLISKHKSNYNSIHNSSSNRNSSQKLDRGNSEQLLLTWSSAAADALVGEFLLPAGLTVTHALRLV